MDLTPIRWSAVVVVVCAAAFAILLPLSRRPVDSGVSVPQEPLAVAMADLANATADAHAAVREYRAARGLDRWTAVHATHRDSSLLHVDRSVPLSIAPAVRDVALGHWSRLGLQVSPAHAEVFVYVDSTEIPRAATPPAFRRPLEPRRFVDVAFLLPDSASTGRCLVLVRLRGATPAHVAALRNEAVTGVCAFFAAFGAPGPAVRSWLTQNDFAFARQGDWDVPRAPVTDQAAVYGLSADAARCLTGALDPCRAALGVTTPTSGTRAGKQATPAARVLDAAPTSAARSGADARQLGFHERRFLADVVRDIGRERFARFWQSDGPPAAAFEAAAGVSLDAWTQRWLARTYGSARARPMPRVADALWLAAAVPLLLVVAARPRDRVLVERFRAPR